MTTKVETPKGGVRQATSQGKTGLVAVSDLLWCLSGDQLRRGKIEQSWEISDLSVELGLAGQERE